MKKRILAYLAYVDELLQKDNQDWEEERKKHLVQIGFYAHERTVHLIVMVLFAICTLLCMLSFCDIERDNAAYFDGGIYGFVNSLYYALLFARK